MFVISSVESIDYGVDAQYPMFVVADRARAEAEMARLTRQDATAAALESARSNAMITWRQHTAGDDRAATELSLPVPPGDGGGHDR